MKKSSAVLFILILPLLTTIAFLPSPTVDAWGHATHFFIVNEAVENIDNATWQDVFEYYTEDLLSGSIAPDVLWQDWENHLYYPETGYGNAPAAAAKWYDFARANFTAEDWNNGFFAAGVMSHYFTDPCIPVHTDDPWVGHSAYEDDINANLGSFSLSVPAAGIVTNVSQLVVDDATYSHQYYDMVYDAYPAGDSEAIATNATIKTLTEDCLDLAIEDLLCLFYNLTSGLNAPDVTITYDHVAMIDFAHGNDYAPDQLIAINMTLAINGYELIEQETAITTGSLTTVDLLIMTCAEDAYTVDELSAIGTWFQSGAKSLLLTGRGDFDTYQDNLIMNQVLTEINSNIRINDDNVYMEGTYNPWYNDITTIPDPVDTVNLTFGVDGVSFFSPSSLYFLADDPILPIIYADVTGYQTDQNTPEPAVVYDDVIDGAWGNQIPLAAVEELGTGRVLVAGTTFFSEHDYGDAEFDNIDFLENFLEWATGNRSENTIADVDEIGPRISDVEWDPTSPEEGQGVNVSATVADSGGVSIVNLKYNNGTHDVTVAMTVTGGDAYTAEIEDVTSGTLDIIIEAIDNDANVATRAFFTISWNATATNTTTSSTGGGATIPMETLILIGAVVGAVVVIVIIVFVLKSRKGV
ncbi:MAG: zinc dependent phospholipase C family protein [Candidatus Thorarchaeota archaeon]